MVPMTDELQRAIRGEARDVNDAYYLMDRLDSAAMDPTEALQAVTGMRIDALVYEFPVAGKTVSGISVKGAKALAARRGGFDVLEPTVTRETMVIEDRDGNLMDVPAYRAVVRVRDTRSDTTFLGVCVEQGVMVTKDGRQRLDNMADRKAISKATRNAILDHFTAVTDAIEAFVSEARKAGQVFVMGETSSEAERVSQAIAVNKAKRLARQKTPMGKTEAGLFRQRVEQTEAEGKLEKLSGDLLEFMARQWPGLKLNEVPADASPILYDWLNGIRAKAGLAPVGETPGLPAVTETPAETLFDEAAAAPIPEDEDPFADQ
jgi:hypothetical protein